MKILCELEMSNSPHLYQVYSGFIKLEKLNIINLKFIENTNKESFYKPVVRLRINNKINVVYDTLDGFNWIEGTKIENLEYFKNQYENIDYYFKRSYNNELLKYAPSECKVLPLGLFYRVNKPDFLKNNFKLKTKFFLNSLGLLKKGTPHINFMAPPIINNMGVMLFTRLWDSEKVSNKILKAEINEINYNRIKSIEACRKEFKSFFTGGVSNNLVSQKYAKHLILDNSLTDRRKYLERVKNTPIIIVNNGLHNSIGGRLAEGVAASRAIISEPINFKPTGDFYNNKNYLSFTNELQLIEQVDSLLIDEIKTQKMMLENHYYYNNYLKAEQLILNTLISVFEKEILFNS